MSLLERRYRTVLRLLPASYRAEREEEMVAAYLEYAGEVPDELGPRPRFGEIASIAGLALRVRLAGATGAPRYFAWGETVRTAALFGLALQATLAVAGIASALMLPPEIVVMGVPVPADTLVDLGAMVDGVLWLAAYVALARGAVRPAKIAAGAAVLWDLGYLVWEAFPPPQLRDPYFLLAALPLLALLAGFHRDAPPARRSWWAALLPPVLAGGIVSLVNTRFFAEIWLGGDPARVDTYAAWMGLPRLLTITILAAAAVLLIRRASAPLLLALAGCALLVLLLLVGTMVVSYGTTTDAWIQCTILTVVALTLAVTGWRRLPVLDRLRERSG
ncbi:hypothetical protein [Nonomuraea typhae]|uniref:hypothetical protein n=1 Tax=Nonomuraea typhae TaxID=2603600 RepID=UPI0012FA1133|nr:hypothetical protein [Nonomuraea typhae]